MRMLKKMMITKRYQKLRVLIFIILFAVFIALLAFVTSDSQDISLNPTLDQEYPEMLRNARQNILKHMKNETYLDYTGAGVYNDIVIEQYIEDLKNNYYPRDHQLNNSRTTAKNVADALRSQILEFVGASPEDYSVVFVASATQALKTIGEYFPFGNKSVYAYTKYNHNSVLGIRKYATDAGGKYKCLDWPINIDQIKQVGEEFEGPNLLAFPFEDNFAGTKVDHETLVKITIDPEIRKKFFIIGDVAAFLPSNPLELARTPVDAAVLSFYKIIGYPNTGALIIRNDFAQNLNKHIYGETSIKMDLSSIPYFRLDDSVSARFEDEQVPLSVNLAIKYGFDFFMQIGMKNVQDHVWNMTKRLYNGMKQLKHSSGASVAKIYGNHEQDNPDIQGGIVAFNLRRTNGSFFGYSHVVTEASQAHFHLRGGCHCNPGACFTSMNIDEPKVFDYFSKKVTCGDNNDIVDGVPLGSVRASVGWGSTEQDVDSFIEWLRNNFVF